ncbi:DUF2584 domain-containing protein [Romeriopsis navalis]|nr:DUF2584 domain-containing protein [Romeriopsis navalis]
MPCEMNSILKLSDVDFPATIAIDQSFTVTKSAYRLVPIDVPIQLVNSAWQAIADVVITQVVWSQQQTQLTYRIHRVYAQPFALK